MGLNWAAALSNVADGMGRIAQVKYSEFMRQDEAAKRAKEREIDFIRQKNLARFNVDAQKKIEDARIAAQAVRDQADSAYRMESLSNQRAQIDASAASAAAQARSEAARLKILEDQAGYAKDDRALQQQLSVWRVPMEAAQAEMAAVMEQRKEKIKNAMDGVVPDTSYEDGLIMEAKRKIDAAVDGQIGFMVDSDHIKMAPDVKDRYLTVLSTPKEDGTFPSKIEAMQRANNPVLEADPASADPAATGNEFIPTGGTPGPKSSASVGVPQEDQQQFSKPPVSEYTTNEYGQVVPKISLQLALKQLDPRTVSRLQGQGHKSVLADDEIRHIKSLGYQPEDFRQMFRSGSY